MLATIDSVRVLGDDEAERLMRLRLTYDDVGSSLGSELPAGFGHLRRACVVGTGRDRFDRAVETLLTWGMHERSWMRVTASDERITLGTVALLRLGPGPLAVKAPVRVVRLVDESRRQGFAYGTLPGHPERGEESFVVELDEDDRVRFAVTAFSRPATLLSRAGGPVSRVVQSRITDRYLRAV